MTELIYSYSLIAWRSIKEKTAKLQMKKKINKTMVENKLTVTIETILWELNLYCKLMSTNEKLKTTQTYLYHPPQPVNSSYSFLNWWKTTKPVALKYSDFVCFYELLYEKLSVIAWVDYSILQVARGG